MVIVSLLILMLIPAFQTLQARAEKGRCAGNLSSLYVAAQGYVSDHQRWPQIAPQLLTTNNKAYAKQWVEVLRPYKVAEVNWICPTTQRLLKNPDYRNNPKLVRVDYIACPFDPAPFTPNRWATMPWFVERGDVHAEGNLIVFTDGSIRSLRDVIKARR